MEEKDLLNRLAKVVEKEALALDGLKTLNEKYKEVSLVEAKAYMYLNKAIEVGVNPKEREGKAFTVSCAVQNSIIAKGKIKRQEGLLKELREKKASLEMDIWTYELNFGFSVEEEEPEEKEK